MPNSFAAPLLVVEDVLVGGEGVTLLPAVARVGLPVMAGDTLDVLFGEEREEVLVLAVEPDRDPERVRLRVRSPVPVGAGFEVWPSQSQSHVTLKAPIGSARAAGRGR